MNNRKYLTSTGLLLKSLNSEDQNMNGFANIPFDQHSQQQQQPPLMHFNSNFGFMNNNPLMNSQPNQFDMFGHHPMNMGHQSSLMPGKF
jgi:hypothetical protein